MTVIQRRRQQRRIQKLTVDLGLSPHPFLFGVIERKRNDYCGNTFLVTVEFPDLDFCSSL